jgi:multiple sugar transport system ATP-binding protein
VHAVRGISLRVDASQFYSLLGPSGWGKTTTLRCLAGVERPSGGEIEIDGQVVYSHARDIMVPTWRRDIGMVFQNYAIFPHMTVYDNIAFGLKMQKKARDLVRERVETAAKLLHIENMLERYPGTMSGGQRQRIAVARAIAYDAEVLLMDEPLSNLDALLRLEMRAELKGLLTRLGMTTIYVTHDQIEALSMGDRIAVMRSGHIIQIDSPSRVYDMPADQFVGSFIGNPPMNFLRGRVECDGSAVTVKVGDLLIAPPQLMHSTLRAYDGKDIFVGIRAENTEVLSQPADGTLPVEVEIVEPLGAQNLLTIRIDGSVIKVSTHPDFVVQMGSKVWLRFPENKIRWIDRDTGRAITPDLEQVVA